MNKNFLILKRYVNVILDIVLGLLAVIILIFMFRQIGDLAMFVMKPLTIGNFTLMMQEVISFFMLFEFIMMILRYIQEGHHIPIRYLILICITAILRQLLVLHDEGIQTLLLSLSILLLVIVLYVLGLTGNMFYSAQKKTEAIVEKKDTESF